MNVTSLTRENIIQALIQSLEPIQGVYALWEGGAAGFNRVDQWSDIDLHVDVDDQMVDETLQVIEETLVSLSPIDLKFEVPQPNWHGHAQTFFRLQNASPFLLVDIAVMKHSSTNKFLEREMHGKHIVYFDKAGVVQEPELDRKELQSKLGQRLEYLQLIFEMFQILTLKELNRGNDLEALAFYHSYTLRPLVELLRIRHAPERHNFHTRYIHYDLPEPDVKRLHQLYFVADGTQIRTRRQDAEEWFKDLLAELKSVYPVSE